MSKRVVQLSFKDRLRKDGLPRRKMGRPIGKNPSIRHTTRPVHSRAHPMHVTLRAKRGLPSFRSQTLFAAFVKAFRMTRREGFRIVEFSVQSNHLHLIVEATDKDALSRGMKSFTVRANRLFNVAWGRKRGAVWGDRYHRRDLTSPRAVRNALSSGAWFEGRIEAPLVESERPTPRPRTWLLTTGWRKRGRLHLTERQRNQKSAQQLVSIGFRRERAIAAERSGIVLPVR